MTFSDISYKMFKANFRRYLLFFLCNSFTIMIFFSYSTIFTNTAFMNGHKVNSTISSMIIAPSIVVVAFSLFFITYAQTCFTKYRKPDFGLFMTLGMTNNDIAKIIIIENSLIGGAALFTGILWGIVFSKLLSFVMSKIIDLNGITFGFSYKSFLYTIVFFASIYVISILISIIASRKYEVLILLKETKHEDKNRLYSSFFASLSIVLLLIAIIDGAINIDVNNEMAMYRSVVCCFLGSYLFITNIGLILNKFFKKTKKRYFKNLIFLTNLEHSLGQSKKIMFTIMILVNITIFFANIPIGFLNNAKSDAIKNNPYDISYSEIMGRNKISEEKLGDILRGGETELTEQKSVSLINYRRISLFSDKELNQKLNTNFSVSEEHFINLFDENLNDGYKHPLEEVKALNIETEKGSVNFKNQGHHVGVVFNPILATDRYLILNDKDYAKIKSDIKSSDLGELKLFNFKDWEKTDNIVYNLTNELQKYNEGLEETCFSNIDIDRFLLKPQSKIGRYNETIMGGRALLFYHSFIGVLFFIASGIILHFKLMTELEMDKKKYEKLYKIGITDWEIEKIISKELLVLFFVPQALAIIIAIIYSYIIMPIYLNGQGIIAVLCPLGIGMFYIGFQYVFYRTYKKHYVRNFC